MISLSINGLHVSAEKGATLLEVAQFYGFPIPTLCHNEGLSPYGACRLCVVEINNGFQAKLVTSCTYPAEEGMIVRTASERVIRARKMIIELLLASCPQSKTIQDLAAKYSVSKTPVLEAIRYLEGIGFVEIIPHTSLRVTKMNKKEVQDLYRIQCVLEELAIREATPNLTEKDYSELERYAVLMERYSQDEDYYKYSKVNIS